MLFTFGVEDTFNTRVEPSYVLDMIREQILLNKNYENVRNFYSGLTHSRVAGNYDVVGQTSFELTLGNEAWGRIFEVTLGKRVRLADKGMERSPHGLRAIVGQLGGDLTTTTTDFSVNWVPNDVPNGTYDLIIGNEFLTGAAISGSNITGASRGQGGTTAEKHNSNDLVYLVSDQVGRKIDLCSPDTNAYGKIGLTKSLSLYILRDDYYHCYTGVRMDQLEININPENIVNASISFTGAYGDRITPLSPILTYDNGQLIGGRHITPIGLLDTLSLRRFYINLNNSFVKTMYGWSGQRADLPVQSQNVYGQMTWLQSDIDNYLNYINNVKNNLSLQMSDWTEPLTNLVIFNCNDLRVNVFSPQLVSGLVIQDSAPFYTYGQSQVYLQY